MWLATALCHNKKNMRKFIFLIPFFLFACSKNDRDPRISARQQPSKIEVFSVDTATGINTLQFQIIYFYDEVARRYDSVSIAGQMFRFGYSKLTSENKILLNFTNTDSAYEELIFDANFYSLRTYNEISAAPAVMTSNNLQFDNFNKLTNFSHSSTPSSNDFVQTYLYKNDSIFVHTQNDFNACQTNDTIVNTFIDMSTTLPYLLFVNINNTCGTIGLNMLKALPVSNYTNRFPYKIINELTEISFEYFGDSKSRLAEARITIRDKNTNLVTRKLKFVVTY